MANKLYEEGFVSAIASAIRTKNGLSSVYSISEMPSAILSIKTDPILESLVASENGSYLPESGYDGFGEVVVSVPDPVLVGLTATSNSVYVPASGQDGFSQVTVSVPDPALEVLTATSNGTYTPSAGKDGFSQVVVSLPIGDGSYYPGSNPYDPSLIDGDSILY